MVFLGLSAASAVLLAVLAVVLFVRRPPAPLWPIVFVCQGLALLWVVGDLWATNASTVAEKQLAFLMLFSGSVTIAPAWWETTRRYVRVHGLGHPWLDSRLARLPLVYGAVFWLLAMTNYWHGQFITPVVDGPNVYHWGIRTVIYTHYTIGAAIVALCGWVAYRQASSDLRRNLLLLAAATLAPAATNLLHLNLPLWPREDTTALGLGAASLIVLYGVLRVRLFSSMPTSIRQVFQRVPLGLLMLDRGGQLVAWNPAAARLLGGIELQPDMRLLSTLAEVLKEGDDRERLQSSQELTDLLALDAEAGASHVFRYAGTGDERWLELSLVPVPRRQGGLTAVCLSVSDVTVQHRAALEREELATQMRDLDKLQSLGRMAGGVAHDFNNLLTSIVGNTQLALDELDSPEDVREYLDEVRESARMAANLTEQLLSYAGRSDLVPEPVSLSSLVRDIEPLMARSLARNVEIRTRLVEDLPLVNGDPVQLRQLILNLVLNAIEAIGDDEGWVTVRTHRIETSEGQLRGDGPPDEIESGRHVLLEVSDSGCGMDESTRRRAFEPFYSTKSSSRGLGLAAVFGIVRAHGGSVTVTSEPGRGSAFQVWLPGTTAAARKRTPALQPRALPRPIGETTILVVDDLEGVRRVATRVLSRAGFRVHIASSAREAVRIFRKRHAEIDLVLLDLTMPEGGGDEALRMLEKIDPGTPILLTSGFDESDAMSRIDGAKPGGFLHKPWEPAQLVAAVERALSISEAGRG